MTRREVLDTISGLWMLSSADGGALRQEAIESRIARIENRLVLKSPDKTVQLASLSERMADRDVPGLSIAVINNYRIEWVRHYGVTERETNSSITARTLFQAGSISKPVTAIAVLRLFEQGKLHLDEDVNRYLKSWKVPANAGWQPKVSIRQLVTHTAGTTVHGFAGYPKGHTIPTLQQVLQGVPPASSEPIRVDILPGLQSRYSGGGYCILQQVLIDLLGKPFPQIMQDLVLQPAGMADSTYEQPLPSSHTKRAACGHRVSGEKVPGGYHTYPEMAPAGLWTTADDLAKFVLQVQFAANGRSNRLLRPESAEELFKPHVEDFQGFGVALRGEGQSLRFEHGGWDEGFVSNFVAYRHYGSGAVVMANSDQGGADIEPEILRSIANEYQWPEYEPESAKFLVLTDTEAKAVSGAYALELNHRAIVAVQQDHRITLQVENQPPVELLFTNQTKAVVKGIASELEFVIESNGTAARFTLSQGDKRLNGKRVIA